MLGPRRTCAFINVWSQYGMCMYLKKPTVRLPLSVRSLPVCVVQRRGWARISYWLFLFIAARLHFNHRTNKTETCGSDAMVKVLRWLVDWFPRVSLALAYIVWWKEREPDKWQQIAWILFYLTNCACQTDCNNVMQHRSNLSETRKLLTILFTMIMMLFTANIWWKLTLVDCCALYPVFLLIKLN